MSLVEQWNRVESGLDPRWADARLSLRIEDETARSRAAALLAPAGPGVAGSEIRFFTARRGSGVGPEAVRRMLKRIDAEGISGTLTLVASDAAPPEPAVSRPTAAAEWDAALAVLPSDWSDILCELELDSSADIERAAVLVEALNPIQGTGRPGFRFRSARERGYGASAGMVRRCLERLDNEGIGAEVRVLDVRSDTRPVYTQGPVWFVGGKQH
ncbi:MAG: hypothetical protein JO073_02155 [Actinobacteria bacterium]|nr:hypothetical protein [Actinomycetota bacterium]